MICLVRRALPAGMSPSPRMGSRLGGISVVLRISSPGSSSSASSTASSPRSKTPQASVEGGMDHKARNPETHAHGAATALAIGIHNFPERHRHLHLGSSTTSPRRRHRRGHRHPQHSSKASPRSRSPSTTPRETAPAFRLSRSSRWPNRRRPAVLPCV